MLDGALARTIEKLQDLDLDPRETAIVAIGRGGFIPAQYAAYALGIRNLYSIQSSLYNKDQKTEVQHIAGVYNIPYDEAKNIIVMDDIYDSGTTLDNVMMTLEDAAQALVDHTFDSEVPNFIPCVLYTQKKKRSKRKNIIWGRTIKKVNGKKPWIIFPWDDLLERTRSGANE